MKTAIHFFAIVFAWGLLTTTGCKKKEEKEKGAAAKASLSMSNGTGLRIAETEGCEGEAIECWTPSVYGLKILNVYASPDEEGAISGPAGLIWNNAACGTLTTTSEIEEKEFDYDYMDDCSDADVEDYFELARDSEEVNEELNSQQYKILPGTYNYVQMTFCVGGSDTKNAQFQAEGMSESFEVESGTCGISSAKADPAIVVGEGESIVVDLTYDLTNIIVRYGTVDADNCYVSDDESVVRCFGFPKSLTPGFAEE